MDGRSSENEDLVKLDLDAKDSDAFVYKLSTWIAAKGRLHEIRDELRGVVLLLMVQTVLFALILWRVW